jgi:hypothetical protein
MAWTKVENEPELLDFVLENHPWLQLTYNNLGNAYIGLYECNGYFILDETKKSNRRFKKGFKIRQSSIWLF